MVSHLKPNLYFRFFPSEPRCVKVTCLPPPFHTSSLSSPDIRAAAFSNIVTVRRQDRVGTLSTFQHSAVTLVTTVVTLSTVCSTQVKSTRKLLSRPLQTLK